jgi:hypothetical protein
VVLFRTLEWIDREMGTFEAVQFAREYENSAPEGHFSVYLELLEAGRMVCCETGSGPRALDRCTDCAILRPEWEGGSRPLPVS